MSLIFLFIHKFNNIKKDPLIPLKKLMLLTANLWPDKLFLEIYYWLIKRKRLKIDNPITFDEKLQWLKLYDRDIKYSMYVDKIEVKKHVANTIGEEFIIPTIKVYDRIEDINVDELPEKFVLKTAHGGDSCGVFICNNRSTFNHRLCIAQLTKSLKQNLYSTSKEWPYKNVKKRIFAESYIDASGCLFDYKFYCFNGVPEYCQVIRNRENTMSVDFYDMKWQHQEFVGMNYGVKNGDKPVDCPKNLDKMVDICTKLSQNIPFVRVDLYNIEGRIYFGEMTFFPAGGFGTFIPGKWNYIIGQKLILPAK